MHACKRSAGFTAVEAIVTVAVLAILLAAAGPSLATLVSAQQVKNAGFDVSSTLITARSEALTRNVSITVAPVAPDNWALGWVVTDDGGNVLRRQNPYSHITVTGPARVIFNSDGRPDNVTTPFALTAAELSSDSARCVRVRLNGRPSVAKGGC